MEGCHEKSSEHYPLAEKQRIMLLVDSINKLDSLATSLKVNNHSRALIYAKRAYTMSNFLDNPEMLAKTMMTVGMVYLNKKNDSCYFFYNEASKIISKFGLSDLRPSLFYNLSDLYFATHDYQMTTVLLDSAIRSAQKEENEIVLSNAYNSLGSLKKDLKDKEGARILIDSAYRIANKHSLFNQMGAALGNLALFEADTEKSIHIQKDALELLQKSPGSEEIKAMILANIALRYANQDSAIKYYKLAIETIGTGGSYEVKIGTLNNLAYSYLEKNDLKEAEKCLITEAIPLAEKEENFDWMSTLYDTYSDVLTAQGKTVKALSFEKKANHFREVADIKQASDQVRLLQTLLEVKNKELTIQTFKQDVQQKENRIQKMKIIIAGILLIMVVLAFVAFWFSQRKRLRIQKELVASAKKILDLEENQKGRLAMELHDLTSPLYNHMLREIESSDIEDKEIKEDLHLKLTQLAERIRQISHRMDRVFIEQFTFNELVKGACDDMLYFSNIPIKLKLPEEPINVSQELGIHLFRIVQELLANAAKYVKEGKINLAIACQYMNIYILYEDNGPGFDPKNRSLDGIGLANIYERTKLMGGIATLSSSPGAGTKWTIIIPFT